MPILSGLSAALSWIFRSAFGVAIKSFFILSFQFLEPFIVRILVLLGFTSVTIKGVDIATDVLLSHLEGLAASLSSDVLAIMGIMKLDVALSMIFSAVLIKFSLTQLNKTKWY